VKTSDATNKETNERDDHYAQAASGCLQEGQNLSLEWPRPGKTGKGSSATPSNNILRCDGAKREERQIDAGFS